MEGIAVTEDFYRNTDDETPKSEVVEFYDKIRKSQAKKWPDNFNPTDFGGLFIAVTATERYVISLHESFSLNAGETHDLIWLKRVIKPANGEKELSRHFNKDELDELYMTLLEYGVIESEG